MTPLDYLEEHKEAFRERLLDFLRIPSVSSLPEHKEDVARAGEWVATSVREAGLENVQILPTGGHPVVYGEWLRAPGKPTVLVYGHFDTQPVDPLNGWTHPPFAPVIEGDKVYARGASDDKGNMLAPILAVEALLKTEGKLPVNLKVLFEGQEEIGSPQLPSFIASNKDLLACDLVVSADGGQWESDQPNLLVGLRGICALQIDVPGSRARLALRGLRRRGAKSYPRARELARLDARPRRADSGGGLLRRGAAPSPTKTATSSRRCLTTRPTTKNA